MRVANRVGYSGLRFGFYHLQKGKLKYNPCLLVAGTKGDSVCEVWRVKVLNTSEEIPLPRHSSMIWGLFPGKAGYETLSLIPTLTPLVYLAECKMLTGVVVKIVTNIS